jgi:hypothetical protein
MATHYNEVSIDSADSAAAVERRDLHERAAAAGTGAGGTAKAMAAGEDPTIFHHRGFDVPEMKHAVSISPVHLQHLVEVAIEDFAGPTHTDGVAAHQTGHSCGIKVVD